MAEILASIISREYSDLDLNLNIHPIRKDVNKHTGDMAVIHAVKNLLMLNHYEAPFQPDKGSNIRKLLFEQLDNITAIALEREIRQTISNYEPRVNIKNITVNPDLDNNAFQVKLEFYILNTTDPIKVNITLSRIR